MLLRMIGQIKVSGDRFRCSLRKQPSFCAPGPSGVSQEGRLRFTAENSILMTYVWTLSFCINQYHLRFLSIETTHFSSLHYTPRTKSLCPAANVLHSHICTSCASNFRRIRSRTECFRNTGSWWDPLGGSKPNLRVNSHIWIMRHD